MSGRSKIFDHHFKTRSLKTVARQYLMYSARKLVVVDGDADKKYTAIIDPEKWIKSVMDSSNHQLGMYGSAGEFLENMKIFANFPGASRFFGVDVKRTPTIFYSMKNNEEFICKSDLFVILLDKCNKVCMDHSCRDKLAEFLDKKKPVESEVEFVKFDEKVFEGEIKKCIGSVCPCKSIEKLNKYIDKRPEMFLPNSGGPITVRLFEDGDKKFALVSELFKAFGDDFKVENGKLVNTIGWDEIQNDYSIRIQNIEFIRYPIVRAKHRAVPIRGISADDFLLLSIDVFMEIWREWISGFQMFTKNPLLDSVNSESVYQILESFIDTEEIAPYFVKISGMSAPKDIFKDFKVVEIKEIQNAKEDGFTVQNLKNELVHLGLTTTFPKIEKMMVHVISEMKRKNTNFKPLKQYTIFDAVEHCQLNCIIRKDSKMRRFVLNQNMGNLCGFQNAIVVTCEEHEEYLRTRGTNVEGAGQETPILVKTSPPESQKFPEVHKLTSESQKIPEDVKTSEDQKTSESAPENKKSIQKAPESLEDPQRKISELEEQVAKLKEKLADEKQKASEILEAKNREIRQSNEFLQGLSRQLLEQLDMQ